MKTEIKKNALAILGYNSDEITLTCKSGMQKYYFNTKIGVDPALFVKHKYGNLYNYVLIAKALPLKIIIETPQFTMLSTATKVEPMKLDSKMFELPVGIKTAKSPY